MKLYYWAAQLCAATSYFSRKDIPSWIQIENNTIELPLKSYIYSAEIKQLLKNTKNPIVRTTVSIWHQAHVALNEESKLSTLSPIWGNVTFKPARADMGFKMWMNKGVCKLGDLYNDGVLMSFEQLTNKYDLPKKHFFKYLQVRSFITNLLKSTVQPPLSTIENMAINHHHSRGLLSKFYNILIAASKESSLSYLQAWRSDMETDILVEEWNNSCILAQKQTINTRFRLVQYKWLFRTYITPVKLHHFNPNIPDDCVKCGKEKGTLYHCMWQCEELQIFWKQICALISDLIECKMPLDGKLCILHIFPNSFKCNTKNKKLVNFCLVQAKYVIALKWKDTEKPGVKQWIKLMSSNLALEKLTYIAKGKLEDFKDIWLPFLRLVKDFDL